MLQEAGFAPENQAFAAKPDDPPAVRVLGTFLTALLEHVFDWSTAKAVYEVRDTQRMPARCNQYVFSRPA